MQQRVETADRTFKENVTTSAAGSAPTQDLSPADEKIRFYTRIFVALIALKMAFMAYGILLPKSAAG